MPAGAQEQPLGFATAVAGETVTVILSGDLDVGNECALARRLAQVLEGAPSRLVFEMPQVDYVSSAAARLITVTGLSLPEGTRPVISQPSPVVRRVLQLTGLDAFCDLA